MSYSKRSRYSPSPSPFRNYRRFSSRSRSPSWDRESSDAENPGNNLYVTGLSPRITKRELEKHFSSEGTVVDVHLVFDPWTRRSRGFGFVTMSNVKEANRCIKYLDRSALEGRVITVEKARRRRGRTPTPGKYLGLRTVRERRRSPTYSPYARSRSGSYSSERGRSRSCSPYYSRRRTPSHSPSPYRSTVRRRKRSYSPYDSPNDRRYTGPDDCRYRGRYHSLAEHGYRGHYYQSVSRSISPRWRSRHSYSRSVSPRWRKSASYSPSVSPRPRISRKGDSRSISPDEPKRSASYRDRGSYRRKPSREGCSYRRSRPRSGSVGASSRSFSRSVTPRSSSD